MPQASLPDEPWFVRAFDRVYLNVYPHRNDSEAEEQADAIQALLGVTAGQRVLDAACGAGRYARALAKRGLRVTGVDLSGDLLEEARERSPFTPGAPTYLQMDIRELPFAGQFEGAVSMFTSFGYFDTRDDDVRVMSGVRRALVPGGRFVIDYLNEAYVRANLEPASELSANGLRVRMNRRIEDDAPGGPRVVKEVSAESQSTGLAVAGYVERVRLYTADDIDGLLEEAGLRPVGERLGDVTGAVFDVSASRLVRVAEKPGRVR